MDDIADTAILEILHKLEDNVHGDHSFSTFAKFTEKVTFFVP